ncbi:MAG: OB-fold domain-containing protein [Halieaceae bacterium]|jgi:uncharacterized OB-fold protein|nr:OB-fold domain-containing protein [Halieaceae bacterium]
MATVFHTGLPDSASLTLQCCGRCRQVSYPPRELCGHCLADELQWQPVADRGVVQSLTRINHSLEPDYNRHLPWTIGSIALDCGPVALAHLPPGTDSGAVVRVRVIQDKAGNRMLVATGIDAEAQRQAAHWLHTVGFQELQS